jgi:FK506-binding protein 1
MGVTKETIRKGDGENFPKKGNRLSMHYKGTFASNGKKFDSSYDRGAPLKFKIGKGEVIQGWDEGGKFQVRSDLFDGGIVD